MVGLNGHLKKFLFVIEDQLYGKHHCCLKIKDENCIHLCKEVNESMKYMPDSYREVTMNKHCFVCLSRWCFELYMKH